MTSLGRGSLTGGPSGDSACGLGLRGHMDILGMEGTSASPCEEAFSGTLCAPGEALDGFARTARLWTIWVRRYIWAWLQVEEPFPRSMACWDMAPPVAVELGFWDRLIS